jgi:hypothetical protein
MGDDTGFWIAATILIIMFWGEPDLHDALVKALMPK